jgi:hypothetical protein
MYSPSLIRYQGEVHATTFECTQRREETRRWETSFRPLFTGQNSYLLGPILSAGYRVETWSELGGNLNPQFSTFFRWFSKTQDITRPWPFVIPYHYLLHQYTVRCQVQTRWHHIRTSCIITQSLSPTTTTKSFNHQTSTTQGTCDHRKFQITIFTRWFNG